MVDTGLLRKNEFKESYKLFKNKYKLNIKLIDSKRYFTKALKIFQILREKEKLLENYSLKFLSVKQKNIKM